MAPDNNRNRNLLFPIGALVFSEGIDHLVRQGLNPLPFFLRHSHGDWGEASDDQWQANNAALESGGKLESLYILHPGLSILITSEADRSTTIIHLPSEC